MKSDLRYKYLSRPRYNRYLMATGNDINRGKRLYNANIRLAQAFHPAITQFEVILRNSLNLQLGSYFVDNDWIINQKNRFMRDPSLRSSRYFIRNSVLRSENKLRRRGVPITSGKIVSDQTFGFWVSLFLSHHYRLIGGQPIQIFQHKPSVENRASLYDKLDEIREFRNRVNHCEPICFVGPNIDCTNALQVRTTLLNLIRWVEPELIPFFDKIDNIQNKVNNIMQI